jgi:hypothetical protein
MWTELLAQRSDPLIRSFEIADETGRVLLILPFGEVLDRARKRPVYLRDQVRSAQALLETTRTLTDALLEKMNGSKQIIESARETMRESRTVLQRLSPPREW